MKKRKENPPKPKEFANPVFAALKGVQAKPLESQPVKAPESVRSRPTEPDDMDLFLLAMAGVERVGVNRERSAPSAVPQPVRAAVRRIEESEQQLFLEAIKGLKLDVRFEDTPVEAEEPVRPRPVSRMKQLRRGTIRIDYELDLHGLTRDEALDSLEAFIRGACRRGQKAVLVITGKGLHSPEEPVVRKAVEKWMQNEGKEMVAEFFSPPREMGGDGAFAVFLRQLPETRPVHG